MPGHAFKLITFLANWSSAAKDSRGKRLACSITLHDGYQEAKKEFITGKY